MAGYAAALASLALALVAPAAPAGAGAAELPEGEATRARGDLDRRDASSATVLPARQAEGVSSRLEHPRLLGGPSPLYPREVPRGTQALVVARCVLTTDGRLHDPEVLFSIPPVATGGRPFVEAILRAILARRYAPALLDGEPVEVNYHVKVSFRVPDANGAVPPDLLAGVGAAARAGDPRAQYVAAVAGVSPWCDGPACPPDLQRRLLMEAAAKAGVPEAQLEMGRRAAFSEPEEALRWLAPASAAGLAAAQLAHAELLLGREAPPHESVRALLLRAAETDEPHTFRRAVARLACADGPVRSPDAAFIAANRIAVDREPDPLSIEVVAAARAAVGDFEGARDAQRRAIRLAKKLGWSIGEMRARLGGYESNRPCSPETMPGFSAPELEISP